jgi:hypothetical protein
MTAAKGREMLQGALVWCEQQGYDGSINDKFMRDLRKLIREAATKAMKEKKQAKIDAYFLKNIVPTPKI